MKLPKAYVFLGEAFAAIVYFIICRYKTQY